MTSLTTRFRMAVTAFMKPETYMLRANSGPLKVLRFQGWQKSRENNSAIDDSGNPLPWMTYPSIEFIKQLNLQSKLVLEWGSGNSSKFFSQRVKAVHSIEHDHAWFEKVKSNLSNNQNIYFSPLENYSKYPESLNMTFDIIVIDGMLREECTNVALRILEKGGMIILDNSERYPEICSQIRNSNFFQVDFHGFGPINEYTWTTSIFISADSIGKFPPLTVQPCQPVGGEKY